MATEVKRLLGNFGGLKIEVIILSNVSNGDSVQTRLKNVLTAWGTLISGASPSVNTVATVSGNTITLTAVGGGGAASYNVIVHGS